MKLKLKNKLVIKKLFLRNLFIGSLIIGFIMLFQFSFNTLDWKAIDLVYKISEENGYGPKISDRIKYLNITNNTYLDFKRNILDRTFLTKVNESLSDLSPEAVIYDLIFSYPSFHKDDSLFAESIKVLNAAYLPNSFKYLSPSDSSGFVSPLGEQFVSIIKKFAGEPIEIGVGNPPVAKWTVAQMKPFLENARGSGHINCEADPDGIYRKIPLFVRLDSLIIPTISLSVFLNYNEVPLDSVTIIWGEKVSIPALKESFLEHPVEIPIDKSGYSFIPFAGKWKKSYQMLESQNFLRYYDDPKYYNDLTNFFESNFILIADISTGISDLGDINIEKSVPLVTIHAAFLNALLNNYFIKKIDNSIILFILVGIFLFQLFSGLLRKNSPFYIAFFLSNLFLILFSFVSLINKELIPISTLLLANAVIFIALLSNMQNITSTQEEFLKSAFSRYVPESVVDNLMENPSELKIGGAEKELTILFSDLEGFTSISEKLLPEKLVKLLNKYLTEMTEIIIQNNGTIDKYLGDGIMAEYGAPIFYNDHADKAVESAILMHKKLVELNKEWKLHGFPKLRDRIGIHTGKVIVGNMGSARVFDYTVIGDSVNLASRLEGVNKIYNTHIVVSENTFRGLTKENYYYRPLDYIKVMGKCESIKVYEVIDFKTEPIDPQKEELLAKYNLAFQAFSDYNFDEALKLFEKVLLIDPEDRASINIIERIKLLHGKKEKVEDLAIALDCK